MKQVVSRNLILVVLLAGSFTSLAQTISKYIVVDQFGYRPVSRKIAVIRDPKTGFDAAESFTPGSTYQLIDKATSTSVLSGSATSWKAGVTDASSGDKIWWFDFSSVTNPGTYYVLDVDNNVKSYDFIIDKDVYKEVLKHAVRTFFYQRAGFEKNAAFAGSAWADGASHVKNLQDLNARQYNKTGDVSSELDVSGGWYDAGDYNKYTTWTANYVADFMRAYIERPGVWGDDYNIPESGNKIPDILDEAKWGIDHLLRMQRPNGSMLSIVGLAHGSPPSSATGPSYYGTPSTSATLHSAAAFALASKVYGGIGMKQYAETLKTAAIKAWNWAIANPAVIFKNNDSASGTSGLGAGQQETDDYGRLMAKLKAACFLFEITGDAAYRSFVDNNYTQVHLIAWTFAYPFETANQETLLYYANLPGATPTVSNAIRTVYKNAMNGDENFAAFYNDKDPYGAHIKDYTWGSNATKGSQALMFLDMITYGIDATKNSDATMAAEGFVHYLHGTNPFSMVYLSNMYAYGAKNSVNEFYHSWFTNGSAKWDRVGTSTFGPAPGFVTGGPNPSYDRDGCCATNTCGGSNALCNSESLTPPKGQPAQKSYKDFNTSWPLNSWSVTENSNGYQLNYIRMLSYFVEANYDCSGTENGTATLDVCSICSGGSTGISPITDASACSTITSNELLQSVSVEIYPNPTHQFITIVNQQKGKYKVVVTDAMGKILITEKFTGTASLSLADYPAGMYLVIIEQDGYLKLRKIMKL
ncbi:MAG: glycoside hydrolase family 9 protein [Cyclobacteriaceae bacterium]|nr:glycoside hydrolase family 9 protein [Cyclobacteriaceae bacterium]